MANAYRFIGDDETALFYLAHAEQFCPERNEHLMWMAEIFNTVGDYESMLGCTKRLMEPSRKNPFPNRCFLLVNYAYSDTGSYVHELHNIASSKANPVSSNLTATQDKILTSVKGPSL